MVELARCDIVVEFLLERLAEAVIRITVDPVANGPESELAVVSLIELEGRHVDEKDDPVGKV